MSELTGRPSPAENLAVVDPIRVPGVARAAAAWGALPRFARLFVGLAIIGTVGRLTGLLGDPPSMDLAAPITLVTWFLPEALLVLLPAFVLWRRRDAATATPVVLWGAVAIAVAQFSRGPIERFVAGGAGSDPIASWAAVAIVATIAKAAGWLAIASGLASLNPPSPSRFVGGLANLAAVSIVAAAITSLSLLLLLPAADLGDPGWNSLVFVASAVWSLELAAWAILARSILRGLGDRRRPPAATATAAVGVGALAATAFLTAVIGLIAVVQIVFALSRAIIGGDLAFTVVYGTLAPTLVVVAFGLGLADTSVRIPGRGEPGFVPEPQPDPIHWPTSFEEDNVPYHPELVPEREAAHQAAVSAPEGTRGRRGGHGRGGSKPAGADEAGR